LATEQIKIRSSQQIRISWGKIAGEKAEGQIARRAWENIKENIGKNKLSRVYRRVGAGEH
jgi:hypothetical protein